MKKFHIPKTQRKTEPVKKFAQTKPVKKKQGKPPKDINNP
jgi:hypothetical protein